MKLQLSQGKKTVLIARENPWEKKTLRSVRESVKSWVCHPQSAEDLSLVGVRAALGLIRTIPKWRNVKLENVLSVSEMKEEYSILMEKLQYLLAEFLLGTSLLRKSSHINGKAVELWLAATKERV